MPKNKETTEHKANEQSQEAVKTAREILLSSQKPTRAQSEKKSVVLPSQRDQSDSQSEDSQSRPDGPPPKKRKSATARAKEAQEEARLARKEAKALQEKLEALETQKAVAQEETQQQMDLMGEATVNSLHAVAFDLLNRFVIPQYPWPRASGEYTDAHIHLNKSGWEFVKWALPDLGEQINPGVAYGVALAGFVMQNKPTAQAPLNKPAQPTSAQEQSPEPPAHKEGPLKKEPEPEVEEPGRPAPPPSPASPLDPLGGDAI